MLAECMHRQVIYTKASHSAPVTNPSVCHRRWKEAFALFACSLMKIILIRDPAFPSPVHSTTGRGGESPATVVMCHTKQRARVGWVDRNVIRHRVVGS